MISKAFVITFLSGMSTLMGALLLLVFKENKKILIYSLSFAAGVMLFISILDLIPLSIEYLSSIFNNKLVYLNLILFIFVGIFLSKLIDNLIPENKNGSLYKTGIISMIAIILHNIPEGIEKYITSSNNITVGTKLAIAIALHNIPEGISIFLPIYYSTRNKNKGIIYTLISGMSEVLGAILAKAFLMPYINNLTLGFLFSLIAGIMIYISTFSLAKEALSYKDYKSFITFFIIGILFVIISLNI